MVFVALKSFMGLFDRYFSHIRLISDLWRDETLNLEKLLDLILNLGVLLITTVNYTSLCLNLIF